jgi:spore germination protein YaaH
MRIKTILTVILFAILHLQVFPQENDTIPVGIHQEESEYYGRIYDTLVPAGEISSAMPSVLKSRTGSELTHMVCGWHPYWANTSAYLNYDYEALTHIAWFSLEVDTATGGYSTIRGWNTTPVIGYAHQKGVKVILTVTNFGADRNTKILTDTTKQWVLINTIVDQLRSRNGDGVNFDFESVPASMKTNMVSFCRRAVRGIKAQLPAAEISFATPAVNWSDGWDLGAIANSCDYIIMMGYNYYWSGSSTAGPVAPVSGETYNITRSIQEDYLSAGVPRSKLLLGVPWYGYDWPVESSTRKSATTGTGTSRTYYAALLLSETWGKTFDGLTGVPWVSYQSSSQWRQMWFDDSLSLAVKNDLVKSMDLAGIGIWALSYEAGRDELWNGIKAAFIVQDNPSANNIIKIVPNPVRDESAVYYSISEKCHVTMKIYDTGGRLVAAPVDRTMEPGYYSETVNAASFASGVYICVLRTSSGKSSYRFAVVKQR